LRFKLEVCLLTAAIALFVLSSVFYSYPVDNQTQNVYANANGINAASAAASFPYQTYALSSVGFGSILMVIAALSYQHRSKQLEQVVKQDNIRK
jgi:cellobiose-specific phosphotransferase system component IIC